MTTDHCNPHTEQHMPTLVLNFSHTSLVHFIMCDVKGRHDIVIVGRRGKARGRGELTTHIPYSSIYTLSYSLLFDFSMLGTTLSK